MNCKLEIEKIHLTTYFEKRTWSEQLRERY